MMGVIMEDKRLFERFSARFPVKFRHARNDYGTDVFLRDASAQGARILSKTKMFLNDSISLVVKLADGIHPLTLNGRVVWIKKAENEVWDVGVEFHKIDLMRTQRLYKMANNLP